MWKAWIAAWLLLVATSVVLHRAAWPGGAEVGVPFAVQTANNISHTMTAPGWMAVRVVGSGWRTGGWVYPAAAAGAGWAMWLGGLHIGLHIRRRLLAWPGPAAAGDTEADLETASPSILGATAVALGPADSSRRRFMIDVPLAVAAVGASGALVRACAFEPWDLQVRRYRIAIHDLPQALEGLRAVQLSDTHLGPRIPPEFIQSAVSRALSLEPDLVLLTGDYIHAGNTHIDAAADLFRPLVEGGAPVAAVLGNHDWYGDGRRMRRMLKRVGISVLDNRREFLCARTRRLVEHEPASGVCLSGLADLLEDAVDPRGALAGLPRELPCVLLSHNPDAAEMPVFRAGRAPRVDVMISGHTHGGQVYVPLLGTPVIPSRFGQKYAGGLVQGPAFRVLVSRGVGMSILPVRLGVPPEISEITFVRA